MYDDRLIIVCGMAHSGTTILTYLLAQHPFVHLFTDGNESWLLENTIIPNENLAKIEALCNNHERILTKRPWQLSNHSNWLAMNLPNARYINCIRDMDVVCDSWAKSKMVWAGLRDGTLEHRQNYYKFCMKVAEEFRSKVKYFEFFKHEDLLTDPGLAMQKIARWLELPEFQFNVSKVGKGDIRALNIPPSLPPLVHSLVSPRLPPPPRKPRNYKYYRSKI